MSELDPIPELPDDTPIDRVGFSTRVRNVLSAAGLKTIGRRGARNIGRHASQFSRFWKGLCRLDSGLQSHDGVRQLREKAT
jgi:hypothetical protein